MLSRRSIMLGGFFVAASQSALAKAPSVECGESPEASDALINSLKISLFSPRASAALSAALVNTWAEAEKYGIVTPGRAQHLIAQMATETGGMGRLDENLYYSASGLRNTWPKRFTKATAAQYEHDPEKIANFVYGNRKDLGNNEPGDGWRFRGSGYLQLTGRHNFTQRGSDLGMNLVGNPEIVRTPVPGFRVAMAFWRYANCNTIADRDDLEELRRRINGGTNGLNASRVWLARARRFINASPASEEDSSGPTVEEIDAVQGELATQKVLKLNNNESAEPEAVVEAMIKFRSKNFLPKIDVSGLNNPQLQIQNLYDLDFLYTLTDPRNFRK